MDIRRVIADNIRFIREKHGISQELLAAKSGISPSYMGYIERASKAITVVKLEKIAKALGVPLGLLLEHGAYKRVRGSGTRQKKVIKSD